MLELSPKNIAITPLLDKERVGLIYIPEQAKERCDNGIVKYVGRDVTEFKAGDHVLFSGYTGTNLNVEGEGLMIIMNEDFVVAKITEFEDFVMENIWIDVEGGQIPATYEMLFNIVADNLQGKYSVRIGNKIQNRTSDDWKGSNSSQG